MNWESAKSITWRGQGAINPLNRGFVNRQSIRSMISLLDYVYKLGVSDARDVEDEGLCRLFIQNHTEPGQYGFITDGYDVEELEWQLRLHVRSRLQRQYGVMQTFFASMRKFKANFLSCFLPVAQCFYNKGIKDYIEAPTDCDFNAFCERSRAWWTRKGIKNIKPQEYVDTIQLMCFDLRRRDMRYLLGEADDWRDADGVISDAKVALFNERRRHCLKPTQYESFICAVGLALQTYNLTKWEKECRLRGLKR